MSTRLTTAVVIGLALSQYCTVGLGADVIESWKMLEEELAAEIRQKKAADDTFDVFSWTDLKTLDTSRQIEQSGLTFWRGVLRSGQTMSQIVAYHCVAEHAERFKTDAAVSFLLLTKQDPSFFRLTAAGEHLRTLPPTQSNLDEFSKAMSQEFSQERRLYVGFGVSQLPKSFLEAWIREEDHFLVPPATEAIIANALLRRRANRPAEILDLLETRIKDYAKLPGFPRVVYLLYCRHDHELVVPALKSILADESISDLEFEIACFTHQQLIRKIASELAGVEGETAARRIGVLRKRILQE